MVNRQVEGIIIASTQKNKKQIESLKQEKFPFVLIDRFYPDCDTDYVMVDNSDGTKKAVEHLLGLGRKKLGFVTLNSELEVMDQRKSGFKNTLQDAGLPFEDNMVQEIDRDDYVQETKSAIETLVSYPSSVDAIVFATHFLAAEGLRQLKKVGIRVPQDVAIISFGELSAFDLVDPPITAIKLPTAAIGNTAFDMLMNRIKTKEPSHHHEKRQLNTSLEIRRSCGTLN
jgi:LacI family transcriptional regulator